MFRIFKHILTVIFFFTVITFPFYAVADLHSVLVEYKVKAGFLVNFAKFLKWPDDSFSDDQSPMVIGILGENPFKGVLKQVEKKTIQGRPVKVVYLSTKEDSTGCHLVFISESEWDDLSEILLYFSKKPIVTVGDVDGFAVNGGIIEFVNMNDKLGFLINASEADVHGIEVPANLLNLAVKRY